MIQLWDTMRRAPNHWLTPVTQKVRQEQFTLSGFPTTQRERGPLPISGIYPATNVQKDNDMVVSWNRGIPKIDGLQGKIPI